MRFSERQTWLLRHRLQLYRRTEGKRHGIARGLPWKTIAARIPWDDAGLSAERLRQFAEGINDASAPHGRKHPTPDDVYLSAIYAFLASTAIALIHPDEMAREEASVPPALFGLLDHYAIDAATGTEPPDIAGDFRRAARGGNAVISAGVSITPAARAGLFELRRYTETYVQAGASFDPQDWPAPLRKRAMRSRYIETGWLVSAFAGKIFGVSAHKYAPPAFCEITAIGRSLEGHAVTLAHFNDSGRATERAGPQIEQFGAPVIIDEAEPKRPDHGGRFSSWRMRPGVFTEAFGEQKNRAMINAVARGDAEKLRAYLDDGAAINYRHPSFGQNALHVAALNSAHDCLAVLARRNGVDFSARDHDGYLPSELAYLYAQNARTGAFLIALENASIS